MTVTLANRSDEVHVVDQIVVELREEKEGDSDHTARRWEEGNVIRYEHADSYTVEPEETMNVEIEVPTSFEALADMGGEVPEWLGKVGSVMSMAQRLRPKAPSFEVRVSVYLDGSSDPIYRRSTMGSGLRIGFSR